MTSHPTDDGFHEIQLNGKQLVFLFMAATVVSVVIFLCGVLVGRGVRTERGATLVEVPPVDQVAPTVGSGSPETTVTHSTIPPPALDDYPSPVERLQKNDSALDELKPRVEQAPPAPRPAPVAVSSPPPAAKPVSAPAAKPAAPTAKPATPAASATPANRPAAPAASEAKSGYVVQLVATNSRSEADAMAKRLSAKGYDAFVQAPADNAPAIFRVRVGNYPTRSEAENAAARLEKEGKFKPWVAAR